MLIFSGLKVIDIRTVSLIHKTLGASFILTVVSFFVSHFGSNGGMIDSVSDLAGAAADLKKARRRKSISSDSLKVDRLPPHSPEAEQGVLGCVLLSPNECMGLCIEKLKGEGHEVFYDLRHQTIYENLALMYDKREAIDVITLQQRLKDKQLLDQIGGIAYLGQLQDAVPSAANLSYCTGDHPGKISAPPHDRHLHRRRRTRL